LKSLALHSDSNPCFRRERANKPACHLLSILASQRDDLSGVSQFIETIGPSLHHLDALLLVFGCVRVSAPNIVRLLVWTPAITATRRRIADLGATSAQLKRRKLRSDITQA
jgi:hypothetical protein